MSCELCCGQCTGFAFSIVVLLKELCHEICQEGNDGQTVKKIKTDWNCGF